MQDKPSISVIVPVYNVEKYLSGCFESLLAQTFSDYEAICVNDGSTDSSLAILGRYAEKDSRFKIINQANKGLSGARNTGMDSAIGEYVFFLDSDDYIHPQALEFMHRCAVENNLELVCANYRGNKNLYIPIKSELKYENIKIIWYNRPIEAYFKNYKRALPGMVWTKLYKANLIKDIRFIDGLLYEDEYFTAMVMEKCVKMAKLNFDMYNYYYGRKDAITCRADAKVLDSHLYNIRFLCEHFSYDMDLAKLVKRGKVQKLLLRSSCSCIEYASEDIREHLKAKLIKAVKQLMQDGLLGYQDFHVLGKCKLYRLLHS